MKQFKPNQVVEAIREIGERTVMEGTSFIGLSYTPEGIDVVLFERDEVTLHTDMTKEVLNPRGTNQ